MRLTLNYSPSLSRRHPGDHTAQSQFHSVIRSTFASPTLTCPITPTTPEPVKGCGSGPVAPPPKPAPITPLAEITKEQYAERLEHWKQVAQILRENVVQGQLIAAARAAEQERVEKERVESVLLAKQTLAEADAQADAAAESSTSASTPSATQGSSENPVYRLRLTRHTELGNNDDQKAQMVESKPFPNRNVEARERRKRERERRIREREQAQKQGEDGVPV